MPYAMLRYLASRVGPTVLTEPEDIERVELLRSVKLVEAHIPGAITTKNGHIRYTGAAIVHSLTAEGSKLAGRVPSFPDTSDWPCDGPIVVALEHWQMARANASTGSEIRAA
jgi:hypothetical protein